MRLLLGIILGVALTVGGAYIYDTTSTASDGSASAKPLVNWDVASRDWHELTGRLHRGWRRIAANR